MTDDLIDDTGPDAAPGGAPLDKSPRRIRRMFGGIARRYDLANRVLSFQIDRYWRRRTTRAARLAGDGPVLDVCCGTGDLTFALRKQVSRDVPVIGTDFTPEMLHRARARWERRRRRAARRGRGAGLLAFLQADTLALPFPPETFQVVTVAFGVRNLADLDRGLAEMVRVCRPGGRVLVLEFSWPQAAIARTAYGFYLRHILPRVGRWVAGTQDNAYSYLAQSVETFPHGAAFARCLENQGLRDVTISPMTFGIATLYAGTKPEDARSPTASPDSDRRSSP